MTSYVVDFKDDLTPEMLVDFLLKHGLQTTATFEHFGNTVVADAPEDFVADASLYPEIESIALSETPIKLLTDYVIDSIEIDPRNSLQWWYKAIAVGDGTSVDANWQFIRRGQYGTLYMVDSGCNIDHPEFENRNVTNLWSFIPGNFADTKGHGTALTSIVCGKRLGMSRVTVKQVKIFDKNQTTTVSDIIGAFDAIISDHILTPQNKVVNLSWSVPKNEIIESKLLQMRQLGLHIVCASGNSGMPISNVTPASMPEITTVGSFGPTYRPSDFSDYTDSAISVTKKANNYGAGLDVWAPGEDVFAATATGGYGKVAGTSVASAIYAGCSAAYYGSYFDFPPVLNPDELYDFPGTRSVYGLLDLSEQRYSKCPNIIAQLRVANEQPHMRIPLIGIFNSGETITRYLFNIDMVDNVVIENLPAWLTYENGRITGTAPPVAEVTPFRIVTSVSSQGNEVESLLTLFVVPTGMDATKELVAKFAEPVDYVLLVDCCQPFSGVGNNFCCDYGDGRCTDKGVPCSTNCTNGVVPCA